MIELSGCINLLPVTHFIQNALMIVGIFTVIGMIILLKYGYKNTKLWADNNEKLLEKFPLVNECFINKTTKLQNIENNQEIHEINKKIDKNEEQLRQLQYLVTQINIRQAMSVRGIESDN